MNRINYLKLAQWGDLNAFQSMGFSFQNGDLDTSVSL